MAERGPEIVSRLSLPDFRKNTHVLFARFAAIAILGSSLLLSKNTSSASAAHEHSMTDSPKSHYEAYGDSDYISEFSERVTVCFDENADIPQNVDTFFSNFSGIQIVDASLTTIPCVSVEVTDTELSVLQQDNHILSVSENVELEPAEMKFNRKTLGGDLAEYVGSEYAESHGITGNGQRIGIIDAGGDPESSYDSYRLAQTIESGCVGTTHVESNLYSGCRDGQSRVIGPHAGQIYSRYLVGSGHGDAVAQIAHAVAPESDITHISLSTVKRLPDGEQLMFYAEDIVRAIDTAIELKVDSIVLSFALGGTEVPSNCQSYYPPLNLAQKKAYEAGIPMFVSTGNYGVVNWPACIRQPGLHPMTTVDYENRIPAFAGYKDERVLAARGEDAQIVTLFGTTQISSGTSFASPTGAGLYSLWKSARPMYSSEETMNIFRRYAGTAIARNGDIVPNLNIKNVLRQPSIAQSLGIYFNALFPYLSTQ